MRMHEGPIISFHRLRETALNLLACVGKHIRHLFFLLAHAGGRLRVKCYGSRALEFCEHADIRPRRRRVLCADFRCQSARRSTKPCVVSHNK